MALDTPVPADPLPAPSSMTEMQDADTWNILQVLDEANRIASMTSLEDLLGQMLDLLIRVSGATNGTLYLLDHAAHELVFMVVRGDPEDIRLQGKRIGEKMGIVGAAIQQGSPIVIEDLSNDPRWYREFTPELAFRLRNAITLPLLLTGKPIGAVQIFNFKRAEVQLLQTLGNRMASEVDKTLMLEKVRRSNQRLKALVDILGQVGAILDRDHLLNVLIEKAARLLEAEVTSVNMTDSVDGEPSLITRTYPPDFKFPTGEEIPQGGETQPFHFTSTTSASLKTRPITVGKERTQLDPRVIGNLMAFNKPQGVFDPEDTQLLQILASQASTVLQISNLFAQANQLFLEFIQVLAAAIDAKDPYTRGHSQRVAEYSVNIAQELGIRGDPLMDIRIGSLLHDIGKLGIPDSILTKPGKLTDDEYDQMKHHPTIGYKIMDQVHTLRNVLPAIFEHHERLDGSGYPRGLRGDEITLMGRIVAVADVFDALTSDRPYRQAMDLETTLDHLHKNIGRHFDGVCVEALIRTLIQT